MKRIGLGGLGKGVGEVWAEFDRDRTEKNAREGEENAQDLKHTQQACQVIPGRCCECPGSLNEEERGGRMEFEGRNGRKLK